MAFGSELNLQAIDMLAAKAGKTVVYPRIAAPVEKTGPHINDDRSPLRSATTQTTVQVRTKMSNVMHFHEWRPGDPLETTQYGLHEPLDSAAIVALDDIDLFLVPLLGCDRRGVRLGYGGGFYDRALDRSRGVSLGVGFAWQLVEQLPGEAHDVRVDGFISEVGLTRFANSWP